VNDRPADATRWLPFLWLGGGVYLLIRSGWPPRVSIITVGACVVIALGVGLWFVERREAFRPWRVVIRYVLLGVVVAALGATMALDMASHAGR
jgi:hypothetical protein